MPTDKNTAVPAQTKVVNPLLKTTSIAKLSLLTAIIAIAAAAVAIAVGVMNWNLSRTNNQAVKSSTQSTLKMQASLLATSKEWQQQSLQIQTLTNNVHHLNNHQSLSQNRKIMAISYFVHLANLELSINRDKAAALDNLRLAEAQANKALSANFLPLKKAIRKDITQVQLLHDINSAHIFHKISALSQQIQALSTIPKAPTIAAQISKQSEQKKHWYTSALDSLASVKHLFVIKKISNPAKLITTPQEITYLKVNMGLQLSMAQWALMHHNSAIYQQSLTAVETWLNDYFQTAPQTTTLLQTIADLKKENIRFIPVQLENTLNLLASFHTQPPATLTPHAPATSTTTPPKTVPPQKPKSTPQKTIKKIAPTSVEI